MQLLSLPLGDRVWLRSCSSKSLNKDEFQHYPSKMSLGIYSGCENFLTKNSFSMWLCNKDVVGARSTKERGNIWLWLELVVGTRSTKEMKGKILVMAGVGSTKERKGKIFGWKNSVIFH
ncbi:hypothetical protein WN943_011445 [Citrus x changshan-huyou]